MKDDVREISKDARLYLVLTGACNNLPTVNPSWPRAVKTLSRPDSLSGSQAFRREFRTRVESAEVREFRFCSFESGNIEIRTFPQREEVLELGSSLGRFP